MSAFYNAARTIYRGATALAGPFVAAYLNRRLTRGKEDPLRFRERFGEASLQRPPGQLIWLHAASIGEAFSVLRLIDTLLSDRPALHILVTTGTVSSAQLLAGRLPPRAIHQYVPVDRMAWVRRFLDHWRPDAALWVESEIWPNLIGETTARRIPMLLVNARISPKSFAGWQRFPAIARGLFGSFTCCLAPDAAEAERLRALGAPDVRVTGNLKNAAEPLPYDAAELTRLKALVGKRPVWLAASTHDGEEIMAGEAHEQIAAAWPDLLTVIVPRHPARGPEIAARLSTDGMTVTRRARGEGIAPTTDIYIADTLGELGLFYRLAPIVFIGGSLVPRGGQNMLEPARLDCAILTGPHVENFRAIAEEMDKAAAWLPVADAASLADAISRLLGDDAERARLSAAARAVAATQDHVLDRVAAEIAPFLPTYSLPGEAQHARP